jgi:hypothetical protein
MIGDQSYFYDGMRRNSVPDVLSQKEASRNGVLELSFLGIDTTNTFPYPTEFLVTRMRSRTSFL